MNLIGNINAIPFRRFRGGGGVTPFPSVPGMIARYSALGLTNEQMAANPVWADKTGNGRDLQLKNFSWKRMSGVGGYVQDFNDFRNNATVDKIRIDEQGSNSIKVTILTTGIGNAIYISKNIYQFNKSYFIKISSEGYDEGDMALSFYAPSTSTATTVTVSLNPNGITEIPAIKEDDFLAVYINVSGKVGSFTIEQLPLYPGALVFDGVDDYGVCDNFPILTKEKGYTVVALRQWIEEKNSITALVSNSKKWFQDGAFIFEYNNLEVGYANIAISFGFNNILSRGLSPYSYQTSKLYNGRSLNSSSFLGIDKLVVAKANENLSPNSNVAIWELVFLDHDATEEELTKIKDYFVKTYPWLFPDQAWTVTGKTNEDEDRATIANITGNGNDLVLSNLAFSGNSGYGLYGDNYNNWRVLDTFVNATKSDHKIEVTQVIDIAIQIRHDLQGDQDGLQISSYKVKITGITENQTINYRSSSGISYIIDQDGIYTLPEIEIAASGWYGFQFNKVQESCNITIEQIPEYEGYLVTDGVDDKAVSKQFKFGENFTVILDFKFPVKKISYCGFDLSSKARIQNLQGSGVRVVLKGNKTLIPSNVVRAVTSEGKVYDENWNEYNIVPGNISSNYTMVNLGFDGSNQFAESATKLAGIYNSTLSKDDCIKAYIYLQTLKAK